MEREEGEWRLAAIHLEAKTQEHFESRIEAALKGRDRSGAERLAEVLKIEREGNFRHWQVRMANAYYNPGGSLEPGPETPWETRVSRRNSAWGHPTFGACRPLYVRDLGKARSLFLAAGEFRFAADASYAMRDPDALEEDLQRLRPEPGSRNHTDELMRVRLWHFLAREREAFERAKRVRQECDEYEGKGPCSISLLLARMYEAGTDYSSARQIYEVLAESGAWGYRTAQSRLKTLQGMRDGDLLPAARVTAQVAGPPAVRFRVLLQVDWENMNPISPPDGYGRDFDPISPDHLDQAMIVELREQPDGRFAGLVPAGTWGIIVMAVGSVVCKIAEKDRWPRITVQGEALELPTLHLEVDATRGFKKAGD